MFGIDLGISVSSVTLLGYDRKKEAYRNVIDFRILFGDKSCDNEWKRIVDMMEGITGSINEMSRAFPNISIEPLVSIEEPILRGLRNPRSFFIMSSLYALVRRKLQVRGFTIYSISPLSAKSTAQHTAFGQKRIKKIYYSGKKGRGSLNKKGMIRAYRKLMGQEPLYRNAIGRETLADSFFIALTGLDRKKVGINK